METLIINVDNEKDVTALLEQLKNISYIKDIKWKKHEIVGNPVFPGNPFSDDELNALLDEAEEDETFTVKQVQAKLDHKFGNVWMSASGKEHI